MLELELRRSFVRAQELGSTLALRCWALASAKGCQFRKLPRAQDGVLVLIQAIQQSVSQFGPICEGAAHTSEMLFELFACQRCVAAGPHTHEPQKLVNRPPTSATPGLTVVNGRVRREMTGERITRVVIQTTQATSTAFPSVREGSDDRCGSSQVAMIRG